MKASSLQLETSAITRIRLDSNKAYPRELVSKKFDQFGDAGLESSVEVGADDSDPSRHFVKLAIRMLGSESVQPPYILEIEIIGIFNCENTDPACRDDLIQANGPAVLYGSIRELVMLLTSRGPYQPLVLPTVNFLTPEIKCGPDGRRLDDNKN